MLDIIEQSKILLVDDDKDNADLVALHLGNLGYDCRVINDSASVLEFAKGAPPDLFLLDVMMPDLNGIELCEKIRQEDSLKAIPVIFITGGDRFCQMPRTFKAGGMDYISKPVNLIELEMRVKTHLQLYKMNVELQRYASSMENLAKERLMQLIHSDRLVTLGTFLAVIAHEIRNLMSSIVGNVKFTEKIWPVINQQLVCSIRAKNPNIDKIELAIREFPKIITAMNKDLGRIEELSNSLKDFSGKEQKNKELFRLDKCIEQALEFCEKITKNKIKINKTINSDNLVISGFPQQIEQVLVNLIINALDATEGKPGATVEIILDKMGKNAHLVVSDNGTGIPQDMVLKIWEPFFTTKKRQKGTGLGLFIVKSIIENHGGKVEAGNKKIGAYFDITLPLANTEVNL